MNTSCVEVSSLLLCSFVLNLCLISMIFAIFDFKWVSFHGIFLGFVFHSRSFSFLVFLISIYSILTVLSVLIGYLAYSKTNHLSTGPAVPVIPKMPRYTAQPVLKTQSDNITDIAAAWSSISLTELPKPRWENPYH